MLTSSKFLLAISAGLGLSSIASAITTLPFKTAKTKAGVVDSMSKYLAMHSVHFPPKIMRPENPKIRLKPGVANKLPVGNATTTVRHLNVKAPFPGIGFTGWHPPDCDMGVGPNHIILTVNTAFGIFDKKGNPIGNTVDFDTFFAGVNKASFIFDPCSFYDPGSQRFFICADCEDDSTSVSQMLIAVSQTSDPTGKWYKYGIDSGFTISGKAFWMDYPHFGLSTQGLAFAGNMFSFDGTAYDGAQLVSIPKAQLVNGLPLTASFFSQPLLPTVQPARDFNQMTSTIYGLAVEEGSTISVLALTNPGSNPSLTTTNVTIPSMAAPVNDALAPQGHTMDGFVGDGRLFNCNYQNGHILAAHNINGPGNRIAVRWYDIMTNGYPANQPSLFQAGNISGGANFDFFQPAISMNTKGDIAITFSRSGDTVAPQVMLASRFPSDPLGTVSAPIVLQNSIASTYGDPGFNRWGDYFGIQIDPTDNTSFWIHDMIAGSDTNWLTVVANIAVESLNQTDNPTAVTKMEGGVATGSFADLAVEDSQYFAIPTINETGIGQVASAAVSFHEVATTRTVVSTVVNYGIAAPLGVSTLVYAFNWKTGAWDNITAIPMLGTDAKGSLTLSSTQTSLYVNATGDARILFRGISPQHVQSGATPFTFKINQVQLIREEQ